MTIQGTLLAIHDLASARLRNPPLDPHVLHDLTEIVRLAELHIDPKAPASVPLVGSLAGSAPRTGVVSDRAALDTTIGPDGMQKNYLVLSEEERAKGYVRAVRLSYVHVGIAGPRFPLQDLSAKEIEIGLGSEFAKNEPYPESERPATGRYWSQGDLDRIGRGCGTVTRMGRALAETYARQPSFYGGTFCVGCGAHFPVGRDGEFVWDGTTERVGT